LNCCVLASGLGDPKANSPKVTFDIRATLCPDLEPLSDPTSGLDLIDANLSLILPMIMLITPVTA
jgi:hypothetical protein